MAKRKPPAEELPADNAARIAIYDAFAAPEHTGSPRRSSLSEDELLEEVYGRLRMLVPRELHLAGEPASYLHEKVNACIEAGILERVGSSTGVLRLAGVAPRIRYPDGTLRDYQAGFDPSRERLERIDAKLRQASFDVHKLVPSISKRSVEFKALVSSMRELGYLPHLPVAVDPDGEIVDGRARIAAAADAGVKPVEVTISRQSATPLHCALIVLRANSGRISAERQQEVIDAICRIGEAQWPTIVSDVEHTREWRLAVRRERSRYEMATTKLRFRPDQEPRVQVTADGQKVMIRSLLQAAGLPHWDVNKLRDHAPIEEARSSENPRAFFIRLDDAIAGIEAMQSTARAENKRIKPEWKQIRLWLIDNVGSASEADARDGAAGDGESAAEVPAAAQTSLI